MVSERENRRKRKEMTRDKIIFSSLQNAKTQLSNNYSRIILIKSSGMSVTYPIFEAEMLNFFFKKAKNEETFESKLENRIIYFSEKRHV